MHKGLVIFSLVAAGTIFADIAIAGGVRVSTDKVRATTHSNGSVYVNTNQTSVSVPAYRRTWYPWQSWRTPWRSRCRQNGYQSTTTQTSRGNGVVMRQSSTTSYCR